MTRIKFITQSQGTPASEQNRKDTEKKKNTH